MHRRTALPRLAASIQIPVESFVPTPPPPVQFLVREAVPSEVQEERSFTWHLKLRAHGKKHPVREECTQAQQQRLVLSHRALEQFRYFAFLIGGWL